MTSDRIADLTLAAVVRAAIIERLRDRRWYRAQRRYDAYWRDLSRDNDLRLRELVRVARTARDIARPIQDREDALTRAKAEALAAGDFYAYAMGAR